MNNDFLQIPGYRPEWINNATEFLAVHQPTLDALLGRTIEATYVLWDLREDEHFAEGPVVLVVDDLDGVEVCANKFDELSMTRGLIDVNQRVRWEWDEDPWTFVWRRDALSPLCSVVGQRIDRVQVLEVELGIGKGQVWCLGGIEVVTTAGDLAIYNGLDDTRVALPLEPGGWRRVGSQG